METKQKTLNALKKTVDSSIKEDVFYKYFLEALGISGKKQFEMNLREDALELNNKEIKSNFAFHMVKQFINIKNNSLYNYQPSDFLIILKEFEIFSKVLTKVITDVFDKKDSLKSLDEYGKYLEKSFKLFFDEWNEKYKPNMFSVIRNENKNE